jgi:FMN phosphatase YigB (HAD superfamily)
MQLSHCAIDFDGVVLRRHPIQAVVAQRCAAFVSRKLRLSTDRAQQKNRELYETAGHTVLGLRRLSVLVSVAEFNTFVYRDLDYDGLLTDVARTHADDIRGLELVLQACQATSLRPVIFSNAPSEYVRRVLKSMVGDKIEGIELTTDGATRNLLKPDQEAYDAVDRALGRAPITLVDDSLVNLVPTFIRGNWTAVLVSPSAARTRAPADFLHATDSLATYAAQLSSRTPLKAL